MGGERVADFGDVIGFGIAPKAEFWIGPRRTGEGFRESHIAFAAADRATVDAFFQAALSAGAHVLFPPQEWPQYHEGYYGAFVRDPDGNNVEAVSHSQP
jgi:catechol 2,3-dioxygenase-like lactoylglutathione lyase family enzyme